MVFNLALNYTQNIEDAEEITQDVFLAVYDALDNYTQQAKISTWIYRIAINKSLDFIKAKQTKKRFALFTSLLGIDNGYQQEFNHPGIILENKEALKRIFTQINNLPANQKTVLILTKIEQKPQAEVAEIMQISLKAVESLLSRAKVNLSKKIKP